MSMSPEDFMETAKPTPEPVKKDSIPAPGGVIAPGDFMGGKKVSVPTKPGFFLKGTKKGFDSAKSFWTELSDGAVQQSKEGSELFHAGVKDMSDGRQPFQAMEGFGESLLGALQWTFAGANSILSSGFKHAIRDPKDVIVDKVSSHFPQTDDAYRRAHDNQENPLRITGEDFKNTVDAFTNFTENVFNVAVGGVGAERALTKDAYALMPKELRAEFKARPARDAKKVETAFDELMFEDPEAAKHVEQSITKFSPDMQKLFDKKWARFQRASEEDLNQVGTESARINLEEIEGKFPDISKLERPGWKADKLKIATPEDAPRIQLVNTTAEKQKEAEQQAEILRQKGGRDVAKSPNYGLTGIPEKGPAAINPATQVGEAERNAKMLQNQEIEKQLQRKIEEARLKRAEEIAKQTSKAHEQLVRPQAHAREEQSNTNEVAEHLRGMRNLDRHGLVRQDWEARLLANKPVNAQHIMDDLIHYAYEGPVKDILTRVRKFLPDIQVTFHPELYYKNKTGELREADGLYHLVGNNIQISHKALTDNITQVFVHEAVHAITTRALHVLDFDAKTQLNKLLDEARDRWNSLKIDTKPPPYGLTNVHEFLAEALANPKFQQFLINSEHMATPGVVRQFTADARNLFDAIVMRIGKALGIKPESMPLFNHVMRLGEDTMKLQQTHAPGLDRFYKEISPEAVAHEQEAPESFDFDRRTPGSEIAKGKLAEYWRGTLETFAPEAISKQAKLAGAYIANAISKLAREDTRWTRASADRKLFWAKNKKEEMTFLDRFEKNVPQKSPMFEKIAKAYQGWSNRIAAQDRAAGTKLYEAIDHYIPRLFDNPEDVERFLEDRHQQNWRAPGFTKERDFKFIDDAIKAGFKPRFDNIEDMFLARQHGSDIAEMKLGIMKDLKANGLAIEKVKNQRAPGPSWRARPTPDGKTYWIHPDVAQIIHNAFDSKTLWAMEGLKGDAFRTAMEMKNRLVQLKLVGSGFHPLHIAGIHNATEITRASASMLAGTDNPVKWFGRLLSGAIPLYHSVADMPQGYRLLQAFRGDIKNLTKEDLANLRTMQEGAFIPTLSSQYRTRSIERFRLALAEGKKSALWHAPWALMEEVLQKPIFDIWIPSIKSVSYLRDAAEWTKRNVGATDQERIMNLNRIRKSVDNRYGEMAYSTLFWNKYVKDAAVMTTLSLSWNLGFMREFGGGLLDVGRAAASGNLREAAKSGMLDRPLFGTIYTLQAMMYSGLLSWGLSGQMPKDWKDYIWPKIGGQNPDGTDKRSQTMFFTREAGAIIKHSQAEGFSSGISDYVWNKGSGIASLMYEGAKGVNEWGEQFRDPNASNYKQVEQTLAYFLKELEPISLSANRGSIGFNKETTLNILGFTPAGKYITDSPTQARIGALYNKTYAKKETPFDSAQYSEDAKKLRQFRDSDQMDKYDELLGSMQEKYQLTGTEMRKLQRGLVKDEDPSLKKFEGFSPGDQKALLDKMTEEERDTYLRHAHKKLRHSYEAPE